MCAFLFTAIALRFCFFQVKSKQFSPNISLESCTVVESTEVGRACFPAPDKLVKYGFLQSVPKIF